MLSYRFYYAWLLHDQPKQMPTLKTRNAQPNVRLSNSWSNLKYGIRMKEFALPLTAKTTKLVYCYSLYLNDLWEIKKGVNISKKCFYWTFVIDIGHEGRDHCKCWWDQRKCMLKQRATYFTLAGWHSSETGWVGFSGSWSQHFLFLSYCPYTLTLS